MSVLRIGIIGAGRIGRIHAENLLRHPQAEVAAIADAMAGQPLRDWAAARSIARVDADAGRIMDDRSIDAVFICSPTDSHVSLIEEAARAGKHIFCEKPVSRHIGRTKLALQAAERAGVMLQVGFNRRFDRNFRRLKQWAAEGAVGDPHLLRITSRDPEPPPESYIALSGGLFLDMAIHDYDMARYLCGSDIVEVYASGAVLVDPAFDRYGDVDTAVTMLKFANGAIGVIDNSRRSVYGYDQRAELFGSKGSIAADNEYASTAVLHAAEGVHRDKPLRFFLERYKESYQEEASAFVRSVLHGEPAAVSGQDALQAELAALAAKLSCRAGRPVRLAEAEDIAAHPEEGADAGTRAEHVPGSDNDGK